MTTFLHISFSDFHSFSKNRCVIQTEVVTIASLYFFFNFIYYFIKESFHVEKNMRKDLTRGKHVSEVLTLQQTPLVLPVTNEKLSALVNRGTGSSFNSGF